MISIKVSATSVGKDAGMQSVSSQLRMLLIVAFLAATGVVAVLGSANSAAPPASQMRPTAEMHIVANLLLQGTGMMPASLKGPADQHCGSNAGLCCSNAAGSGCCSSAVICAEDSLPVLPRNASGTAHVASDLILPGSGSEADRRPPKNQA